MSEIHSEVHGDRRARLAAMLAGRGADAALITRLINVRYLTGLASSNAALLVTADGAAVLATDARYAGTAMRVCPDLECVVERDVAGALAARAKGRLAHETHDMTVDARDALDAGGAELISLGRAVEELRTVKDEGEIASLREACAITDRAFDAVLPQIAPGRTEREIAVALERFMVDFGAEGLAFDSIVASGPNGAIPHHSPSARAIESGDLVTMDFGARYDGYHADMTRTVAVGEPGEWQREIYDLVASAQRAGVEAARPGAVTGDLDARARGIIEEAGYGEEFAHGLGHGVGLEIHEAPLVGSDKTGKLLDRVPITVEPGVYVAGRGGVRIEDTLVVRADGVELLTKTTKELLVI